MIVVLLVGLLLTTANSACSSADSFECSASLCATYRFVNGSCILNATSTCTTSQQVPSGSSCVTCSTLAASNCSSICVDFYFKTSNSQCTSCATTYGTYCISCTNTACTSCAYSSGLVLASNKLSCVSTTCSDSNCIECYDSGAKCQTCKSGYSVNSTYRCVSTTCTIAYCNVCNGASACSSCAGGYSLSSSFTACNPTCSDPNCNSCLRPEYCGTCVNGYTLTDGKCSIDCTKNIVTNCKNCVTLSACTECVSGYSLTLGGSFCSPTCADTNCKICTSTAAGTCTSCNSGYALVTASGTCTKIICSVLYCATCSTVTTCSACQSFYTLTSNTCTPTCAATVTNCVLCSSNTQCSTCAAGFSLSGNTCNAICSISSCTTCASSTTCALCNTNYALSTDRTSCKLTCSVANCDTCSTTTTCQTCATGYNLVGGNTFCVKQCATGQVNTGTTTSPVCQTCSVAISNCESCSQQSSTVICSSCTTGYFLEGTGLSCSLCSTYLSNCRTCTNALTCTACSSASFFLQSGKCVAKGCDASVTNCQYCLSTSTNLCQTCVTGFTNSAGVCTITCKASYFYNPIVGGCVCAPATYENNGVCVVCNQYCYTCNIIQCSACETGYYPSGQNCLPCSTNCAECTSATTCATCNTGFYVLGGTCKSIGSTSHTGAAADSSGSVHRCATGCASCTVTVGGATSCTETSNGFSLVAGVIIACDASCKKCSGTSSTACTQCYDGTTLNGGQCSGCTDSFATDCLKVNNAFSTACVDGYTTTFYSSGGSVTSGGTCRACAPNCHKCDSAGPTKCDSNQCYDGFVQILGTTNCTKCLGGCPTCSSSDPNICTSCPTGQYIASTGGCGVCSSSCLTCSGSATTCTSCNVGFQLVSSACYTKPFACTGLSAALTCNGCFNGYKLKAGSTACEIDTSCNGTSSCTNCDYGYYLTGGKCLTCPTLSSNCLTCNPSSTSQCFVCKTGYYLQAGACVSCPTGCSACDTSTFCSIAASGYFLVPRTNGQNSGRFQQCSSPCATCTRNSQMCTSCGSGYTLNGTKCLDNSRVIIRLLLQGSGSNPISTSGSTAQITSNGINNINRIMFAICGSLPASYFGSITTLLICYKFVVLTYLGASSLDVNAIITGGSFSSPSEASNIMSNTFSTGASLDGLSVLSSTSSAQGYSTSSPSSSSTNLGLILGLSIPLVLLLVLIIVIMAVNKSSETDDEEQVAEPVQTVGYVNKEQVDYDRI